MGLSLVLLTELDAVNAMLETVGETPVSSLPSTGVDEAYIARTILHRTSREVQARGLNFNTDRKYKMTRDVNGRVEVPANVLTIDAFYYDQRFVPRLNSVTDRIELYDQDDQTFVLKEDPYVDVVWFFAWEGLPNHVRDIVYISGARRYQARYQSSQIIHQLTEVEEARAWATFWSEEYRSEDSSILSSFECQRILNRRA